MTFETVPLTKDTARAWDEFCQSSDEACFFHTTGWLDYTLHYKPELKTQDVSFLVYNNQRVVAVVPLTVEEHFQENQIIREFSFGDGMTPAPAFINEFTQDKREWLEGFIFEELDRLARVQGVVRSRFVIWSLVPGRMTHQVSFNYLVKHGYLDVSENTMLIDLRLPEEELWGNLRRNHRRNIEKGKMFTIKIFDSANITEDIFDQYKQTHHKAAGRQTRPDSTYELMFGWLKQDLAFLVAAEYESRFVGFEYYSVYKNNVYGFSAANDPDYEDLPIRHIIEWQAILYMKQKKFHYYEIGFQQFGDLLTHLADEKWLSIGHFKKGFGGLTIPWFKAEKYYDKQFFLEEQGSRIKQYAERNLTPKV